MLLTNRVGRWTQASVVSLVAASALALTGCATDRVDTTRDDAADRAAATGQVVSLRGACPQTVVVQTNWWPQAEYGALYGLLGKDLRIDRDKKTVSAPLVSGGVDTGVRLEIRSGGAANGYTPAASELYRDASVTLGAVDTDQAVQLSGQQPTRAVFALLEKSPLVLLWDPAAHPRFKTIVDIGKADTRVLYFKGSVYMDYLTGAGILRRSQVQDTYDGTPAQFLAIQGQPVQQGFLTNEVFSYEHDLPQGQRKVAWQLVSDTGYPNYPEALAIRADRKDELAPCLAKLVPLLQRATVDYLSNPVATNALVVKLVKDFGAFPYSPQRAAYAATMLKKHDLMGRGTSPTVGDFDPKRIQRTVEILTPILAGQHKPARGGLKASELFTNEFIDPAIQMKDQPAQ